MADNSLTQTIKEAEVDARSLSEFIYKPADFMVSRRLSDPIHTLDYYLDQLDRMVAKIPSDEQFNIHAQLRDSVALQEYLSSDNLFNGSYVSAIYGSIGPVSQMVENFGEYKGVTAIAKIKPSTTYTVKVHDPEIATHFRVGTYSNYPTILPSYDRDTEAENAKSIIDTTSDPKEVTFTSDADTNYVVVYVANNGAKPRLKIEEGSTATEYTPPYMLSGDMVQPASIKDAMTDLMLKFNGVINLFDGDYLDSILGFTTKFGGKLYQMVDNFGGFSGKTALVEIEPNTTYTVTIYDVGNSNQFRVVTWDKEPKILPTYANDPDAIGTVIIDDPEKSVHTFTSGENAKYLGVYVSNDGSEPKLQIQEGEASTPYVGSNGLSKSDVGDIAEQAADLVKKKEKKYSFYADLNGLYTKDYELENFYSNPNTLTVAEYHARFESLVNAHSDLLKRTKLGNTEFDYPLYQYETIPVTAQKRVAETAQPSDSRNEDFYRPKIFVTAGIHGREKTGSYSTYYFLKELMENPQNDPKIDFIKRNVKLIFIPMICASGFEDNTYENRNGQNLNRDFKPYGSETQSETRLVARQLDANKDMDYHLDFHTSPSTRALGYTLTDSDELGFMSVSLYNELGRVWQQKHPEMPQDPLYQWGFSSWANDGTVGKYTQEVHGVKSTVFEIRWENLWLSPTQTNNEIVVRLGVEVLANMIIGCVKNLIV